MVYFPKKSHHGYFDQSFQRHFSDKKEKIDFMKKHKFVEGDAASKAHIRRVKEFSRWANEQKRKNPNFKHTEPYPD